MGAEQRRQMGDEADGSGLQSLASALNREVRKDARLVEHMH